MPKPEHRVQQLCINLEPSFFRMVNEVINKEGITASDYGRKLVLWDLVEREMISRDDLMLILVGGHPSTNIEQLPMKKTS